MNSNTNTKLCPKNKKPFEQLNIFNTQLKNPNINIIEHCIINKQFLQNELIYIIKYFKQFDFQTNDIIKLQELFVQLSSIVSFFKKLLSDFRVSQTNNFQINFPSFINRFDIENTLDFLNDSIFQLSELNENTQTKAIPCFNQILNNNKNTQ